MSRRRRLPLLPLVAGAVLGVVLVTAGVAMLTRTERGRERVLEYTLKALGGRLNGELQVERLEGNLFTGARLYDVTLREHNGRPLLVADSAYLEYRLPTFFGGDVVIRRLDLFSAVLQLRRTPGDSLWNYQHVLLDTTRAAVAPGRATLIDRLRVVDADVTVQLPWEPDPSFTPGQQRREIREALHDTSRIMVRRVPGGYLRTMRMRVDRASVSQLSIAPDERGGMYLRVDGGTGSAQLYRGEPLRLREARGELRQREGVLHYRAPRVALPSSELSTSGAIDLRGPEPLYDLQVGGRGVALRDLQWLYPRFPERGQADFRMWLETRPEGTLFRLRDLRMTTPGTRLTGRFGVVVGDTVLFSDVNLRAQPLDMSTVQSMLPTEIPVRGLHIGAVEVRSPAS